MPNLRFNTKIYKKEAIKKTVSAYSSLAKISFTEKQKYINVKIEKIDPDFKNIIVDEFANYVLGLTKKCH